MHPVRFLGLVGVAWLFLDYTQRVDLQTVRALFEGHSEHR